MSRPPVFARFRATWVAAALAVLAAVALPVPGAGAATAAPAGPEDPSQVLRQPRLHSHHTIFNGGDEQAGRTTYHSFRIPSLVRTKRGNLLAFAEGRVRNEADHGDIDVVYKRSIDDGRTWSKLSLVAGDGPGTWGNPTAVVDQQTGRIFLFMSWNSAAVSQFGNDGTLKIEHWGQRRVFLTSSGDDGRSWTRPRDLTRTLLPAGRDWDAIGPGNGIQSVTGPHPGRLIVPAVGRNLYSDNHGRTWKVKRIPGGTSEGTVMELLDGTLVRNDRAVRQLWPTARARWVSRGSIEKGFAPFAPDRALPDSRVAGSAIRYGSDPSRLVFLNPADPVGRCNMTVRLSYDEGLTWPISRRTGERAALSRACGTNQGGYSSMAVTDDRMIGALIEFIDTPRPGSSRSIEFHRLNLAWVADGRREPVRPLGRSASDDRKVGVAPAPRGGTASRPGRAVAARSSAAPARRSHPKASAEPSVEATAAGSSGNSGNSGNSRDSEGPGGAASAGGERSAAAAPLPDTAPVAAETAPGPVGLAAVALLASVLVLLRAGRSIPWRAAALGAARQGPDSFPDQQR